MTEIKPLSDKEAIGLVNGIAFNQVERKTMEFCLRMSTLMWGCFVDDELLALWGVVPPTLLSNQAYLWLYTTELLKEHQFVLVRHSQRVIEMVLEEYPSICGHATVGADKSIRWLKWLGAKFGEPQGTGLPFRIKRHG